MLFSANSTSDKECTAHHRMALELLVLIGTSAIEYTLHLGLEAKKIP
jgi:hypothetical protein